MSYLRRIYRLPAELEETLVADLWLAGTLGVATETETDGRVRLTAWFERPAPPVEDLPAAPAAPKALESLEPPDFGAPIELLTEDEPPETDWMAEYRKRARPFRLGRWLVIDPREPEEDCSPAAPGQVPPAPVSAAGRRGPAWRGRRLLRLPARTAFGTGSHESTRLALELLEAAELSGRAVLDVGTGTGILAFAALAWGAARVVGFDADPVAAFQARANSRLNRLAPRLFAGRPAALAPVLAAASRFDVAVVNVVPEQILPEIEHLLPALSPGASVILSGLLAERAGEVSARLTALGLAEIRRRQAGEWAALELVKTEVFRS
jgi:ribosomal protein L11 methylase PrmA